MRAIPLGLWKAVASFLVGVVLDSTNFATAHLLWVQFDGSLRPPQDVGFPACSGRIGTAAASCLVISKEENDDDNKSPSRLISFQDELQLAKSCWIGAKALEPGLIDNSAEAEYEGLLLGLEKAVSLVHDNLPIRKILVQGDCKTVINQLQESSRPRKLERHYLKAQEWLQQLPSENMFVQFEHIPREENRLCDGLCNMVRSQIVESSAWKEIIDRIKEEECQDLTTDILKTITRPGSLIPFSRRPFLYHQLAEHALAQESHAVLLEVGQVLEEEAKTIWSSAGTTGHAKPLQAQGVLYQIQALQGLSDRKSTKLAVAKERKNRFLLKNYKEEVSNIDWSFFASKEDKLRTVATQELQPILQAWLNHAQNSQEWKETNCLWRQLISK